MIQFPQASFSFAKCPQAFLMFPDADKVISDAGGVQTRPFEEKLKFRGRAEVAGKTWSRPFGSQGLSDRLTDRRNIDEALHQRNLKHSPEPNLNFN